MIDTEQETTQGAGAGGSEAPLAPDRQSAAHGVADTPAPDDGSPAEQVEPAPQGDGEAAPPASQQSIPDGDAEAIEGDLGELVKTAAQRDEYLALAQRTQADFENYRKRVARDAAQAQERGVAKLAKELLPALDNLDRAIEAATLKGTGESEDPLLAGVCLVRSEIAAALARVGIEAFVPLGSPFDPNRHEAMAQQPVEGAVSGTVAEVYQNGYRMGEAIIRPARVLVAA